MPTAPTSVDDWIAIGTEPLPAAEAMAWAGVPDAGAVVCFAGVVRDTSDGRPGVRALYYEAWEETARARMAEIAAEARRRWPDLCRLAILHRTGLLELTEVSVLVVVSTPHRAQSFEAGRFCIDTLKETVPIWKEEHWADGSGWALGAKPIRAVPPETGPAPAGR